MAIIVRKLFSLFWQKLCDVLQAMSQQDETNRRSIIWHTISGSDGMTKSDCSLNACIMFSDSWSHPEVILKSSWSQPEVILKSSWSHPEVILKSSWSHPEVILKSSWGQPEVILKSSWSIWSVYSSFDILSVLFNIIMFFFVRQSLSRSPKILGYTVNRSRSINSFESE